MEPHFELSDEEFESKFRNCTISAEIFSHEAHLRLSWIHITKYGLVSAIQNICIQLKAFVDFAGEKDKYNKTLTVAAIKVVNHFIKKSNSLTFESFISEFPRLKFNFKDLMNQHYRLDIFNSVEAKIKFIEPDLMPFD
ncbi:MAG: hypothetical protein JWO32_377 [Bacteroidetes bacterium]|nr:hypothetical protein [Bacteroidota bacterium]